MATPSAKAGKNARVSVGAGPTFIAVQEWSTEGEDTAPDSSNTEGGGFTDVDSGMLTRKATIKGFWDSANNPHANPPNILEGSYLQAFKLYTDTSAPLINWVTCMVTKVRQNMTVKELVMLDFDIQNKGSYTVYGT